MRMLSDRLKAIALEIYSGETMADIGTDHGYLPLFLWENGICPKVILTDISEASLDKAKANAGSMQFGRSVVFRVGNGIRPLSSGEVDDIVIAGLGGMMMIGILGDDIIKSKSYKKFVLQPRTSCGPLRHWLIHNGFTIDSECLVREGKYICEILTVVPKQLKVVDFSLMKEPPDSIKWEVPSWIAVDKDDLTYDYLDRKLKREEKIYSEMQQSDNANQKIIKENIDYLNKLIEDDQ